MHDQRVGAGRDDMSRESRQRFLRILVVDADAAFHRHRDRDRRLHGGDAIADQRRLRHQAGAEAALLHPIRRTADVEIDLVVAEIRADPRAAGERRGIAAAELQRHRMLGRIEADQPVAVAVQHRAGGHHLGVDQRAARQQAMEEPAVPIGPFHHRRNAKLSFQNSHLKRVPNVSRNSLGNSRVSIDSTTAILANKVIGPILIDRSHDVRGPLLAGAYRHDCGHPRRIRPDCLAIVRSRANEGALIPNGDHWA